MVSVFSTAYFPPIEYIDLLKGSDVVFVESHENYPKQTWRNRCKIITANGLLSLSVPVLCGTTHKTVVRDIRIDNTKRWQQVHIRALKAAYSNAPFFLYFFDEIERLLMQENRYLLDLNMQLSTAILDMLKIDKSIEFTSQFVHPNNIDSNVADYRYLISPKVDSNFRYPKYIHTFAAEYPIQGLSILDMLFNMGEYIESHEETAN